jgi:RNA polymerase sigma factor (sigma-70 family)
MKQLLTDEALFEALKNSNRDVAITQLYLTVFPGICDHAFKIVKDKDCARDIATDRFWKCLDLVKGMDGYTDLIKILYTATRNLSLNFLRKKRNWEEVYREPIDMSEIPDEETLIAIEENEVLSFVRKFISSLPGNDRFIGQMAFIERRTSKEIANELGQGIRSVENKRTRLLSKLRDALRRAGFRSLTILF